MGAEDAPENAEPDNRPECGKINSLSIILYSLKHIFPYYESPSNSTSFELQNMVCNVIAKILNIERTTSILQTQEHQKEKLQRI